MALFEADTLIVERDDDGIVSIKINIPDRTHNVITPGLLADLDAAVDRLAMETRIPLVVVRSGKSNGFLAGADLRQFLQIRDAAGATAMSERGQRLFDKLAALPMPTIAAIHGPCLGGGLELALACDYRLVFDRPDTQLGFPEVELGLLPGWGGTQRLPKVIGLERAFAVILAGKRLKGREAYRWGLADTIAANEGQLRASFDQLQAKAMQRGKRDRRSLPLRSWKQWFLESNPLGRRLLFKGAERMVRRKTPDDFPAPLEALEAIRTGVKRGMEAGLAYERAAAARLALSPACRNLIGLFFQREQLKKTAAEPRSHKPEVRRVGIVGAGVMGAGIAQLAAIKGFEVVVQEVNTMTLGAGILRIEQLFSKAVERGIMTENEAGRRLSMVKGTVEWKGFDTVHLVIEAAVENLDAKRALFRDLELHCRPETVLATNTSSLPVAALQEGLKHPERVAGLHFFNPVHKMPLVEVARAPATGDAAIGLLTRWSVALGKEPVQVKDSPGFVVNRVLLPYLAEAVGLVSEGMKIKDVDHVMRRFGMPMGPLELLDQIGLDVASHVAASMGPVLAGRFEEVSAFEQMRGNGWLGQKSGRGFYTHTGRRPVPNHLAENLLRADASGASALTKALSAAARLTEARERMVLLMVNEAALALSEGVTTTAADLDLAMILGTGWAPHRGGPLRYADDRGLSEVVKALTGLAERRGRRFEPCADLKRRAETGETIREPIGLRDD
jgi:3-hydroxyacyl-CoA dehydrogenase/enoyl-CoA hydratase/3-hydroxybutyryl-CoA epimerase